MPLLLSLSALLEIESFVSIFCRVFRGVFNLVIVPIAIRFVIFIAQRAMILLEESAEGMTK